MVDRIRYPTVSYLPFYYAFFQFLLLTIFNLQANILTTKDILSNLGHHGKKVELKYAKKISLFNFFALTIMIHKYYYLFTRPSVIVVC